MAIYDCKWPFRTTDSHTWPYMASSHDHTWQLWSTYKHRKPYRAKCHSFHFSLYPSLPPSVKFPFIELLKQRKTIQNIKTTQKIKTIQMITMTQKKKTTLKIKTPLMKKDLKITLTSKSKLHQNKLWMKLCQAQVQLQIDSKVRSRDKNAGHDMAIVGEPCNTDAHAQISALFMSMFCPQLRNMSSTMWDLSMWKILLNICKIQILTKIYDNFFCGPIYPKM